MAMHALTAVLPHLRRYALHLTRNPAEADDLVQDTCERVLSRWALFDGRCLRAWAFTMMRNLFIGERRHKAVRWGYEAALAIRRAEFAEPAQEHAVMLAETLRVGRERGCDMDLLLADALGDTQQSLATARRAPIGTIKSAVSRSRAKLRRATAWDIAPRT